MTAQAIFTISLEISFFFGITFYSYKKKSMISGSEGRQ